jgi:hypothetical protein
MHRCSLYPSARESMRRIRPGRCAGMRIGERMMREMEYQATDDRSAYGFLLQEAVRDSTQAALDLGCPVRCAVLDPEASLRKSFAVPHPPRAGHYRSGWVAWTSTGSSSSARGSCGVSLCPATSVLPSPVLPLSRRSCSKTPAVHVRLRWPVVDDVTRFEQVQSAGSEAERGTCEHQPTLGAARSISCDSHARSTPLCVRRTLEMLCAVPCGTQSSAAQIRIAPCMLQGFVICLLKNTY